MLGRRIKTSPELLCSSPLPLGQCLAKSHKSGDNAVLPGQLVLNHCRIVGEVARAIMQRMPDWLRTDLFPDGSELIAAAHDIGKVSPTFQKKIHSALSQKNEEVLIALKVFNAEMEKNWGGHAGVSQSTLETQNAGDYVPKIVGQHHGFSPFLGHYQSHGVAFGGQPWHDQRLALLAQLKQSLGTDFPIVKNALQAQALAGLTTVSDWIGSGPLFEDPKGDWRPKIQRALDAAGFVSPQIKKGLSFGDIFFDKINNRRFTPNATQSTLIEAVCQPGVYVLEAPMGSGKTEAALYAAYQLLDKRLTTGIYFALPTQITSDKIHERVNAFLDSILDAGSAHKESLLVHGNAWLKRWEMGEEGNPGGSWFAHSKRGILAPFAVGTIDQALMAVMNVKHGFVRTFGLAGKVVILDEVHSYDSFTGTLLDALVKALRELHCTVIILSATLTQERRTILLGASSMSLDYPLISAYPKAGSVQEYPINATVDDYVNITHTKDDQAFEEVLRRAEEGQHALWIENTVDEAQALYRRLAARSQGQPWECGLLHSRFTKTDRAAQEDLWVTLFGKGGAQTRANRGRILVGTQVLEQSLDIDADFLVTRMAPTDMLLQRLGRLWRHKETDRPPSARRDMWLLSPDLVDAIEDPQEAFGPTAKVYDHYVLCRSLEVLQDVKNIRIPGEIRSLIEATYSPREEKDAMQRYFSQLREKRSTLQSLALVGLSRAGTTQSEEAAGTRYSSLEATEVLLIRSCREESGGTWVTLLNDERLFVPRNGRSLARAEWGHISAILAQNVVKVASYLAPEKVGRTQISWLADYFYLGRPEYDEEALLRVALVHETGSVRSLYGDAPNSHYHLRYDHRMGYQVQKLT